MRTRSDLETTERETLEPYAMFSADTRGRRHREPEHAYRTAYQRDRDRIVHCTAFRRLEYKTQVFVNTEGDEYRTRLTHTLEVAQIARTVARSLGLNTDLTEALALVHDIGHAPFGHAGERALSASLEHGAKFEHNAHALRIVDQLEARYAEFPGLNLSYETREGIARHGDHDVASRAEFPNDEAALLESLVADTADRLAYNHHDLDDGLRSRILSERDVREVEHVDAAFEAFDAKYCAVDERVRISAIVIALINESVSDLLTETTRRLADSGTRSVADVRAASTRLVSFSGSGGRRHEELHKFLYERFYCNYQVRRSQANAHRFVTTVFDSFRENPDTLPPHVTRRVEHEGLPRAICDHVASMTDRELHDEYRRIVLPGVGRTVGLNPAG